MAQLPCIGLSWLLTKPPFGSCAIYFSACIFGLLFDWNLCLGSLDGSFFSSLYLPDWLILVILHRTWTWWFGRWFSFSLGAWTSSMLSFRGVCLQGFVGYFLEFCQQWHRKFLGEPQTTPSDSRHSSDGHTWWCRWSGGWLRTKAETKKQKKQLKGCLCSLKTLSWLKIYQSELYS